MKTETIHNATTLYRSEQHDYQTARVTVDGKVVRETGGPGHG
jgi:hypothetical protein